MFDYNADRQAEFAADAAADAAQEAFEAWCDARGYAYDDEDAHDNYYSAF